MMTFFRVSPAPSPCESASTRAKPTIRSASRGKVYRARPGGGAEHDNATR